MNLGEILVSVCVQDMSRGASACVIANHWQLRTLAAYLFDGRECSDVRGLLGIGSGVAHGTRVFWEPVELSAEELSAIESTFPPPLPDRTPNLDEVRSVVIVGSGGEPRLASVENPFVVEAASRAKYLYFDYGPWADLYESRLPDGGLIRYEVPRQGFVPPWSAQ